MRPSHLHIASAEHNALAIWERLLSSAADESRSLSLKSQKKKFCMALPGGSSLSELLRALPANYFSRLSDALGPLAIFSLDERRVSLESTASNMGELIRDLQAKLRTDALAELAQVNFLPCFSSEPVLPLLEAKEAYQAVFQSITDGHFDLALVGVGPDGHIASLFPGQTWAGTDREDPLIAVTKSPKPPAERISFSLQAIAQARHVWIYTFGTSKAGAVTRALDGDMTLPLGALLKAAPHAHLFVDKEAMALPLKGPEEFTDPKPIDG